MRIESHREADALPKGDALSPMDEHNGDGCAAAVRSKRDARAIRARRFRSECERLDWRRRRPAGRKDSSRRRFYNALAQRRSAVTRNHIARLNPDGTLDTAFNPNANASVHAIAVQADGKILVAAISTERTASADRCATTSPGLMPPPAWLIRSIRTRTSLSFPIAVQADGQDFSGRRLYNDWRTDAQPIARLEHGPARSIRFNPNANSAVNSIALQADGKIFSGRLFQ